MMKLLLVSLRAKTSAILVTREPSFNVSTFHIGGPSYACEQCMVLTSNGAPALGASRLFHGHPAFSNGKLFKKIRLAIFRRNEEC